MAMTDEEAAAHAISSLDPLSDEQKEAKSKIKSILNSTDPFIDIHELFALYNTLYFRSLLLPRVDCRVDARVRSVSWKFLIQVYRCMRLVFR